MENTAKTNTKRAALLDLAQGGTGHAGPWIEKATLRRPGQEDTAVYAVHLKAGTADGRELVVYTDLETCRDILQMEDATTPPAEPEDCGRIIEDLEAPQQGKK